MRIHITKTDIKEGIRNDAYWCPVARAIRRQFKLKARDSVRVDGDIWICHVFYLMPKKVSNFVDAFDYDGKGKPFSFSLEE